MILRFLPVLWERFHRDRAAFTWPGLVDEEADQLSVLP